MRRSEWNGNMNYTPGDRICTFKSKKFVQPQRAPGPQGKAHERIPLCPTGKGTSGCKDAPARSSTVPSDTAPPAAAADTRSMLSPKMANLIGLGASWTGGCLPAFGEDGAAALPDREVCVSWDTKTSCIG